MDTCIVQCHLSKLPCFRDTLKTSTPGVVLPRWLLRGSSQLPQRGALAFSSSPIGVSWTRLELHTSKKQDTIRKRVRCFKLLNSMQKLANFLYSQNQQLSSNRIKQRKVAVSRQKFHPYWYGIQASHQRSHTCKFAGCPDGMCEVWHLGLFAEPSPEKERKMGKKHEKALWLHPFQMYSFNPSSRQAHYQHYQSSGDATRTEKPTGELYYVVLNHKHES